MMRSLSPTAGSRKGSGDAMAPTGASVLSKLAGEESKINIDKFKSRAEERKKRAAEKDVTVGSADPDSPSLSGGDFVRLANRKGAGGANRFASPSHILNPGAERADEESKAERINFEGEMMRKAKENKLKKYWYTLLEKELYVYKHKDDQKPKTMVNLVGVFIKEEPEEQLDRSNTLYPFTLIFPSKTRTFYLLKEEERKNWVDMIKKAIGYANLFDYYDMKEKLGNGKFGTVKLGIHKKTGKKVAIKIMKKKNMTTQDIELQKREIEILKIC